MADFFLEVAIFYGICILIFLVIYFRERIGAGTMFILGGILWSILFILFTFLVKIMAAVQFFSSIILFWLPESKNLLREEANGSEKFYGTYERKAPNPDPEPEPEPEPEPYDYTRNH